MMTGDDRSGSRAPTTGSVAGPLGPELAADLVAIDFSGVVLVVGQEGVLAEVAQGIADRATGRAITPASRFGTASASKLFTAVTLVRRSSGAWPHPTRRWSTSWPRASGHGTPIRG